MLDEALSLWGVGWGLRGFHINGHSQKKEGIVLSPNPLKKREKEERGLRQVKYGPLSPTPKTTTNINLSSSKISFYYILFGF